VIDEYWRGSALLPHNVYMDVGQGPGPILADVPLNTGDPPPERKPTSWRRELRFTLFILLAIGLLVALVLVLARL